MSRYQERWNSIGPDRPNFSISNGAWVIDAHPHSVWPGMWTVDARGHVTWAFGRRHAIWKARRIAGRELRKEALRHAESPWIDL